MGRFFIEGLVTREPENIALKGDKVLRRLYVEERVTTSRGSLITYSHEVDFFGVYADRLPKVPLTGSTVFVMGAVTSKMYSGKSYTDLIGESVMIVTGPNFEKGEPGEREQDMSEDDLPF